MMTESRRILGDLASALALALAAVGGTWWFSGVPASYVLVGVALYGALAALILRTLPAGLPGPGLGAANRVTLARAALAVPVFALALHPGALEAPTLWCVISLSTVAMVLDGVDGRIARRTGSQSAFGARFDMELDAALIMALCVLVWRSGKVDAWILLIGLMRYAFVAAGWVWPALTAELPPQAGVCGPGRGLAGRARADHPVVARRRRERRRAGAAHLVVRRGRALGASGGVDPRLTRADRSLSIRPRKPPLAGFPSA